MPACDSLSYPDNAYVSSGICIAYTTCSVVTRARWGESDVNHDPTHTPGGRWQIRQRRLHSGVREIATPPSTAWHREYGSARGLVRVDGRTRRSPPRSIRSRFQSLRVRHVRHGRGDRGPTGAPVLKAPSRFEGCRLSHSIGMEVRSAVPSIRRLSWLPCVVEGASRSDRFGSNPVPWCSPAKHTGPWTLKPRFESSWDYQIHGNRRRGYTPAPRELGCMSAVSRHRARLV